MNPPSVRRVLAAPRFMGLLATNFVLGLTTAFILPFLSLWATRDIGMSSQMLGTFMTVQALCAIVVSQLIAMRLAAGGEKGSSMVASSR